MVSIASQTNSLRGALASVSDHRRPERKRYPLASLLLIAIAAMLAGRRASLPVGLNATRHPWQIRNNESTPPPDARKLNFRPADRQTGFLMLPPVEEQLPQRHLARFIVEVAGGLDLAAMSKSYRGSGSARSKSSCRKGTWPASLWKSPAVST